MSDKQPKTITAYVTKFALKSGVIMTVQAEELGTTGRIRVVAGDLTNLEFNRDDYEELEFLAYQKTEAKRLRAIEWTEKDLERMRKLDFSAPPAKTEEAAE